MKQKKEGQEIKETPERFFKLLEAGSLAFSDLIKYAFVIFGITKHGKTTLSHHLVNSSLKAYENSRKQVHYKLNTAKGSHAKIGDKMESQTEIPNKFQTQIEINGHPLFVIDNPGQLDSFGINRVLSNAYFHYRVFSKVENMKIILVFDSNTFTTNLGETNTIFKLFFECFTNFQQISDQILKSIAIIFTKVDRNASLQDIHQRLQAYEDTFDKTRAFNSQQMQFLLKLFKQCKENQKIKLFRKADLKIEVEKCTFLTELHSKLQFFTRKVDENQKSVSLFYNEQKVKMDNVKFSESKAILNLTVNDFSQEQMIKLFEELTLRAKNMFGQFFKFIQKLVTFLVFEYDNCETAENSIDISEISKLKRQIKLRQFILELQRFTISYEEEQKYKKNRQYILQKYKQKLKSLPKAQTFIDRLDLASKLIKFCGYYSDQKLESRKRAQILECIKQIQNVFLNISIMYSNSQQIEKLAKFLYDIKNYMDQLIIFRMIILPDEKEGLQKIKRFLMQKPLDRFLICFDQFRQLSCKNQDIIVDKFQTEFKLQKTQARSINTQILIKLYLKKNPNLLVYNKEYNEVLLKALSTGPLNEEQKIQAVILMFNTFKDHYNRFMHFKKVVNPQNKNLILPQQHFQLKEIKKMILSNITLLKQIKKVKELMNYKEFEKHRNHTQQISTTCWNYIIKLFTLLIQCQNNKQKKEREKQLQKSESIDRISPMKNSRNSISQSMNQSSKNKFAQNIQYLEGLQEIIIEILSKYPNVALIEETFKKLISIHKEKFDQVTLRNCALKLNKKYEKSLNGHEYQCMIMFDEQKKTYGSKLIDILLKQASILNTLYLKDRALEQCQETIKYVQYCPQKMAQIEDKMSEIQLHNNLGQWIQGLQNQKKFNGFEPSLTTKRHLTQFFLDNWEIKLLECVQIQIFKPENQ